MRLLQWLWSWITSWFVRRERPYRTDRVDEFPEQLEEHVVYLVGEGRHLWSAAMLCPCGCGEVIQLNLLQGTRPRWSVIEHDDGCLTLHPSVWRRAGCKSHYFFRNGMVAWCRAARAIHEPLL